MYTQLRNTMLKALMSTVLVLLVMIFASAAKYALATALDTASGWGWGGTEDVDGPTGAYDGIGWISFNNTDCDTNDDGSIDNAACGTVGTAISPYGVNIPVADGPLSGYAWSEHYGWISFNDGTLGGNNDLTGCPNGTCSAYRDGTNIKGWARIIAIKDAVTAGNAGGFDGWISLSGTGYGVSIVGNTLNGYAWSSDLGWINFGGNGGNVIYTAPAPTVTLDVDKPSIKLGDSITLTWTVTGTPADSCVASGDWSGNDKNIAGDSETLIPSSVGVKTYHLECFASGVSSGIKTATVTIPSVNITISACAIPIPVGGDECTATVNWTFSNALPAYNVINKQTGSSNISIGNIVTGSAPAVLKGGDVNTVEGWANGDLLGTQTRTPGCVAGAEWSSLVGTCQNPPDFTIDIDSKLVRSGQTTVVTIIPISVSPLKCDIYGATTNPQLDVLVNPGVSHIIDPTKAMRSKQVVSATCLDEVTGLSRTKEDSIEVVPTIQEN